MCILSILSPQRCKSLDEVRRDLTVLKQVTDRIRILSLVDCGQGEIVYQASQELGMELWLSLWVNEDPAVFQGELDVLKGMISDGRVTEDKIPLISVGSETVYRDEVEPELVIQYVEEVKSVLQENNLNIPVGVGEVDDVFEEFPQMIEGADVIVVNAFPFWEPYKTGINGAASYLVDDKIPPVLALANNYGTEFVLGETGWPDAGTYDGAAADRASPANQAQYLQDFFCTADLQEDWKYFYFTGIDNEWRKQQQDEEGTVEGHFGIFYANLTMKEHFRNLEFSCPGSTTVHSFEVDESVPTLPPTSAVDATNSGPAACSAHSECADLDGDCCPTANGVNLGCCSETVVDDDDGGDGDDEPSRTPATLMPVTPSPTATATETSSATSASQTGSPTSRPTTKSPTPSTDSPTAEQTSGAVETPSPTATVTAMSTEGLEETEQLENPTTVSQGTDTPSSSPLDAGDEPSIAMIRTNSPGAATTAASSNVDTSSFSAGADDATGCSVTIYLVVILCATLQYLL